MSNTFPSILNYNLAISMEMHAVTQRPLIRRYEQYRGERLWLRLWPVSTRPLPKRLFLSLGSSGPIERKL